jgi:hypothetical protein
MMVFWGHPTSSVLGWPILEGVSLATRVVGWLLVILALAALAVFALRDPKERRGRWESGRPRGRTNGAQGSVAESL